MSSAEKRTSISVGNTWGILIELVSLLTNVTLEKNCLVCNTWNKISLIQWVYSVVTLSKLG